VQFDATAMLDLRVRAMARGGGCCEYQSIQAVDTWREASTGFRVVVPITIDERPTGNHNYM
jgi:hypothetical protein